MRRHALVALSALLVSAVPTVAFGAGERGHMTPHQVAATTPTLGPTPPALPAADTVLAGANAAITKANTFHIASTIKLALGGLLTGDITATGDVRLTPAATRLHLSGTLAVLGKSQKLNEDDIRIRKKSWTKNAKTHHAWAVNKSSSIGGVNPTSNNPLKVTSKGDRVVDLVNVGADTRSNVAVWHLHGTYIAKVDSTHTATGTIDYFIGQADSLPYEVQAHVVDAKLHILEDIDEVSSNFAEPLVIKAPKIGSKLP